MNTIAPVATTGALAAAWANTSNENKNVAMKPEYNVPAVLLLSADTLNGRKNTITGGLFEIGCGWHAATRLRPVSGFMQDRLSPITPEQIAQDWRVLSDDVLANIALRKNVEIGRREYEYIDRDIILYSKLASF